MGHLLTLLFILHTGMAMDQSFPKRPLRLVIGFTPGGGVDINARLLAAQLTATEFDRQLREEVARWAEVVKVSGARAD